MEIRVENRFCKGSARKIRPLLYLAKGENLENAEKKFRFIKSYGVEIWQLIKNGMAIAKENNLEAEKVYIKTINCEQSKELKRHRYESKGRVTKITKHQHHLFLTLSDNLPAAKKSKDHKVEKEISKKDK